MKATNARLLTMLLVSAAIGGAAHAAAKADDGCRKKYAEIPYFVDAKNISDPDVLVGIASSVGLPADQAREVIEQRTHKAAVDADWEKSRQYGITGVPTFVIGNQGVVGAQPYEVLEELVRQARRP